MASKDYNIAKKTVQDEILDAVRSVAQQEDVSEILDRVGNNNANMIVDVKKITGISATSATDKLMYSIEGKGEVIYGFFENFYYGASAANSSFNECRVEVDGEIVAHYRLTTNYAFQSFGDVMVLLPDVSFTGGANDTYSNVYSPLGTLAYRSGYSHFTCFSNEKSMVTNLATTNGGRYGVIFTNGVDTKKGVLKFNNSFKVYKTYQMSTIDSDRTYEAIEIGYVLDEE